MGEHAHAPLPDFFVGPYGFLLITGYEGSDFIRFNLKGNLQFTHCDLGAATFTVHCNFTTLTVGTLWCAFRIAPTLIDKYNSKSPPHDGIESNAPSSDISLLYIVNLKEDTKKLNRTMALLMHSNIPSHK